MMGALNAQIRDRGRHARHAGPAGFSSGDRDGLGGRSPERVAGVPLRARHDFRHPRGVQGQVRHERQQVQRLRQVRVQGDQGRERRGQGREGQRARRLPDRGGHHDGVQGGLRHEVRHQRQRQERLRQVRLRQGEGAQGSGGRRGPRERDRPQERSQAVRRGARHDRCHPHRLQHEVRHRLQAQERIRQVRVQARQGADGRSAIRRALHRVWPACRRPHPRGACRNASRRLESPTP